MPAQLARDSRPPAPAAFESNPKQCQATTPPLSSHESNRPSSGDTVVGNHKPSRTPCSSHDLRSPSSTPLQGEVIRLGLGVRSRYIRSTRSADVGLPVRSRVPTLLSHPLGPPRHRRRPSRRMPTWSLSEESSCHLPSSCRMARVSQDSHCLRSDIPSEITGEAPVQLRQVEAQGKAQVS